MVTSEHKQFIFGAFICTLLSTLFFANFLSHLATPLNYTHNDSYYVIFMMKHYMDIFFSGRWGDIAQLPMWHGMSNTLFFNEPFISQALMLIPIYTFVHTITASVHLLAFMTVLLSTLTMYSLAWYFTKNIYAGIIAGIIWSLNPYVSARFPDHLSLISLQWIPLIFLFVEIAFVSRKSYGIFFLCIVLVLQLLSSPYYIVFLSVVLPLYLLLRWREIRIKISDLFAPLSLCGIAIFVAITLLYYFSYARFLPPTTSQEYILRTQNANFSAWISDWIRPQSSSVFYSGLRTALEKSAPTIIHHGAPSEQSLFMGIVPFTLMAGSLLFLRSTRYKNIGITSIVLVIVSFVLSLGPTIHISDSVSFPGMYQYVATLNPLFVHIRAQARFGIFVFFFGSILAAITIDLLFKQLSNHKKILATTLLVFLILAEYWNRPFTTLAITDETTRFYKTLSTRQDIHVVADIPMGNLLPFEDPAARTEYLDTHYLLWEAIYHNKKLLNGYGGFGPISYYKKAQDISLSFPDQSAIDSLRDWGVDAIVLHKDEYTNPRDYFTQKSALIARGIPLLESTDTLSLFTLR